MRCHKNLRFCSKASRYMTFMKSFLRTFKSLTFAFQSFTYLERDKILPVSSKCAKIILETILSSFMIKIPFTSVNSIAITTALRMPWNEKKGITNQGKWREIEEMERDWLSTFPHSLFISYIKICHILMQNAKYGTFVANVTKMITYALWGNTSGSDLLRGSSASCAGLSWSQM